MSKEDDLTMMAYVLIYKALDENGDKLFDLADTPNTPNTCLLYTSPSPRD